MKSAIEPNEQEIMDQDSNSNNATNNENSNPNSQSVPKTDTATRIGPKVRITPIQLETISDSISDKLINALNSSHTNKFKWTQTHHEAPIKIFPIDTETITTLLTTNGIQYIHKPRK